MYKVFVDHRPIIFIGNQEAEGVPACICYTDLPKTREELRPIMEDLGLDNPLYVCCEDVEIAFKSYFKSYKKIKAAGGIVRRKNKFLIIKRNGLWDIPKGKIEKGEERREAAVREIEEECGIEGVIVDQFIKKTYHIFKYKGIDSIKATYWYSMNYTGPKQTFPQIEEGIKKAKWVSREGLFAIRGNTYGSINDLLDTYEASLDD